MTKPIVTRSTGVMGGTPAFYGTRVPTQTLLDYSEAGETIEQFLEGFPSVTRERINPFLTRRSGPTCGRWLRSLVRRPSAE